MKKRFYILFISLIAASTISAQYTQDAEAKTILDKSAQAIQKSGGSKAEFILIVNNTQTSQKQAINGTLYLKGDKFKLLVAETETYYDGKIQWVYMSDSDEVTISAPTADELREINPTAILSSYKQGYKLKKEEDKTVEGKQVHIVNIYPDDRNKPYYRIEIIVEKGTYDIVSINTFGRNGTDTYIKVKKYEKGLTLADLNFVFDAKKYPGVEIIDLR